MWLILNRILFIGYDFIWHDVKKSLSLKALMKIGVMSDTHDRLPTFRRAVAMFERMKVDAIFHAGDYIAPFAGKVIGPEVLSIPLYCCYGNNDGERAGLKNVLPNIVDGSVLVELGGRKIAMNHYIDWLKPEEIEWADIVISGHTHEVVNELKAGKLFLNPGECCGWVTDRCTVAILDLDSATAQIVDVYD